jgi:hypothetical protein
VARQGLVAQIREDAEGSLANRQNVATNATTYSLPVGALSGSFGASSFVPLASLPQMPCIQCMPFS